MLRVYCRYERRYRAIHFAAELRVDVARDYAIRAHDAAR